MDKCHDCEAETKTHSGNDWIKKMSFEEYQMLCRYCYPGHKDSGGGAEC